MVSDAPWHKPGDEHSTNKWRKHQPRKVAEFACQPRRISIAQPMIVHDQQRYRGYRYWMQQAVQGATQCFVDHQRLCSGNLNASIVSLPDQLVDDLSLASCAPGCLTRLGSKTKAPVR